MKVILRGRTTLPHSGSSSQCAWHVEHQYLNLAIRLALPSDLTREGPFQGSGRVTFTGPFGPLPGLCAMATIGEQLQTYRLALTDAQAKGETAIASKIEKQIKELEEFQQRHPEEAEAPSPFEVFCDLNPSDINCRVYDD